MRLFASLGALFVTALAMRARAEDAPPDDAPALHAELARQAAGIDELRASLAEEKHARENPSFRVSGFVQVDWIAVDQESQDQVSGSTGQPLNQDRFTLRRGHLRVDAKHGLLEGVLELDANTTNGLQVRPFDAEVSLHWPESPERIASPKSSARWG